MEKRASRRPRHGGRSRIDLDCHEHHLSRHPPGGEDSRGHEGPWRRR